MCVCGTKFGRIQNLIATLSGLKSALLSIDLVIRERLCIEFVIVIRFQMSKLSSFRLLESYLEDLSVLVDESKRLVELDLSYEHNNHEVRKSLQKIVKFLERNDDGYVYDHAYSHVECGLTIGVRK